MRIIYLGSGSIAKPCLAELVSGPHQLLAVITQPDRPAGRGRKLQPTPIKLLAQRLDLTVYALEDVNAPSALEKIAQLKEISSLDMPSTVSGDQATQIVNEIIDESKLLVEIQAKVPAANALKLLA